MTTQLSDDYSEDGLVEQPAIALFSELGWETANCYHEFDAGKSTLGRENKGEVILVSRIRQALERLNPELPGEAITLAIEELVRDRSLMTIVAANRDVYRLMKDGIKVTFKGGESGDEQVVERVRVIDWNNPANNDFFLASQFWIAGEMYTRRADLVGFVNGLPLVFFELKAIHRNLKTAYDRNLKDYHDTIPHIFWYSAFIILSNGSKSRIGTVTAEWEHFSEWKKINSEGETGIVSLETMIRSTCTPEKILDIIENFTIFMEVRGGQIKLVAKNHQYLGVSAAIQALQEIKSRKGKLGVFWHTQGSGKSISMIFFAQKVLRKIAGNWTFVVVTDRQELDDQIYKNFADAGVITEGQAQATSGEHLKRLLKEDHRYVFTLIHKFQTPEVGTYPKLTDRSDIIVITDEAHRTQYDTLALNMRSALPNAAFIAFTGTPLIVGEEKTRQVFGDYVSTYDFKQSSDDGATVPLYYENRIPEVQLINANFKQDIERLLEEAELDEAQEKKLQREFGREYQLITRDDRLERIAKDIVEHFTERGHLGKAMVVCIDKATAVKMYDKVQKYWKTNLLRLKSNLESCPHEQRDAIMARVRFIEETDMAVVVSQGQNEVEEMKQKGLDIKPHRKRMISEDLDTKFKDPDDPFRLVFVCAMWMTGFDVPCCSTIYLDKPMKNHTLMQTIARANRVFPEKNNGLIVDYFGVFRELEKALAIYAVGGVTSEPPVVDKDQLVKKLTEAIGEASSFCDSHGVELSAIVKAQGFERIKLMDGAIELINVNDDNKARYIFLADTVWRLYKAILPDTSANEYASLCTPIRKLADMIRSYIEPPDISGIIQRVEKLLDESIAAEGYLIRSPVGEYRTDHRYDLSKIDFDSLQKKFRKSHKRTEAEKLRRLLELKLNKMIQLNQSRFDYMERLQRLIDDYNSGSLNVDEFFKQLIIFAQSLNEEEKRGVAEGLTEEELAIFDLLTKPDIKLTKKEEQQVKKVAKELLDTLKRELLVLDWRKRQQSRAAVKQAIEEILDKNLSEDTYTTEIYNRKCEVVYEHVYESYYGAGRSVYAGVG